MLLQSRRVRGSLCGLLVDLPSTTMTTTSHRLARLVGPTLVTMCLAESLNAHIWATSTAPTIFLNGSVIFVSGLAMVQNHNIWCLRWPVLLTLVGWANITLGLLRMVMPERLLEAVKAGEVRQVKVTATAVAALGAVVSWLGWFGR